MLNHTEVTIDDLLRPYTYITKNPGKQLRSQLISAFKYWYDVPDGLMKQIADVVQMLHNSSLLIDDVEDGSDLRRGSPTAHKIFGESITINSANYIYFLALNKLLLIDSEKNAELVQLFTKQMLELHHGQGLDIFWREQHICPKEVEYLQMAKLKTGGLFKLAVQLMRLFSTSIHFDEQIDELIDQIGIYFQIRDDYMNLWSKEYHRQKSFADDLTEGKFSFPVIHAANQSDATELLSVLRQRPHDHELKEYCIEELERTGSKEYTLQFLQKQKEKILQSINSIPIRNLEIIKLILLLLNAAAVVDEKRVLTYWETADMPEWKSKIIHIIRSVQLILRIPLTLVNTVVICYKMVLS
ncbi:hypothetical protein SNEBB_010293 [Seison nebaliae]|nr:hypothetical protein SNEBB_010293 [Seison nebaliae]